MAEQKSEKMFQAYTALRYVLIFIPASYLGSIVGMSFLAEKEAFFAVGFATLLVFVVASLRYAWTEAVGFLWWAVLAFCLGSLHAPVSPKSIPPQGNYAYVIEPARETAKTYRCVLQLESSAENPQKVLAYFQKEALQNQTLRYGQRLYLQSPFERLQKPTNPHQFDFSAYMARQGIFYQTYASAEDFVLLNGQRGSAFQQNLHKIREHCLEKLNLVLRDESDFAVAAALVLGQKQFLDQDDRQAYAAAGAMHMLAVSGMHVGILLLMLKFLLVRVFRQDVKSKLTVFVCIGGVWAFALLTGLSDSVLRASIMFSLLTLSQLLERPTSTWNTLAVSALLILTFKPLAWQGIGFQLSYLAVGGIVYFTPRFQRLLEFKNTILSTVWELVCVSLAAQLVTSALGIYYFGQFPNYFLLTNIAAIYAASGSLGFGLLYLLLGAIPYLSEALGFLLAWTIKIFNFIIHGIASLPFAVFTPLSIHEVQLWGFLVFLAGIAYAFHHYHLRTLRWALGLMLVLIAFGGYELYEATQSKEAWVFDLSGKPSLTLREGLCAKTLYLPDNKAPLTLENTGFSLGGWRQAEPITEHRFSSLAEDSLALEVKEKTFIYSWKNKIYWLGKYAPYPEECEAYKPDVIICQYPPKKALPPEVQIIALRKGWEENTAENVHIVEEEGALSIQ